MLFVTFRGNKMADSFLFILLGLISHLALPGAATIAKGTVMGISPAIVPSKLVPASSGHPIKISCLAPEQSQLQSCHWERLPRLNNGQRYIVKLKAAAERESNRGKRQSSWEDNINCNCTYNYSGIGLSKGDCTMSIINVNEFHLTNWECTLLGEDDQTWIGHLNISDVYNYSKPFFGDRDDFTNGIVYNQTFPASTQLECCVDSNNSLNTSVKLSLKLEERPNEIGNDVSEHPGTGFEKINVSSKDGLVCARSKYTVKPEDNGKRFVCTATTSYYSNEYNETTWFPLLISFGPMLSTLSNFTQTLTANNSVLVEVKFIANPQPNEVTWHLKEDPASGASFPIRENHIKYKTGFRHIQGDSYISTLEILNLKPEEDYRRKFQLVLSNPYGSENVLVQLVNLDHSDPSDNYWIIILSAVGTMIVLILLAALIFFGIRRRASSRGEYVPTVMKYTADAENTVVTGNST